MKGKVCEIQNLHKSVREGVMVSSEVKIPFFFFPAVVGLCLAVRFHLSHRYPNHYCVRHFRSEGVCFRVCFHSYYC